MDANARMTNYRQIIKSATFNRNEMARHASYTHERDVTAWFETERVRYASIVQETCYKLWILERLVARR